MARRATTPTAQDKEGSQKGQGAKVGEEQKDFGEVVEMRFFSKGTLQARKRLYRPS